MTVTWVWFYRIIFVTGIDGYSVKFSMFLFLTENHHKLAEGKCSPDKYFYF